MGKGDGAGLYHGILTYDERIVGELHSEAQGAVLENLILLPAVGVEDGIALHEGSGAAAEGTKIDKTNEMSLGVQAIFHF